MAKIKDTWASPVGFLREFALTRVADRSKGKDRSLFPPSNGDDLDQKPNAARSVLWSD
jgi:hypothetical protein